MAETIVRFDDTAQFAITRVMEAGVRGENEQSARLLAPTYLISADYRLHDRVETTLRSIQVAGHGCISHQSLKKRMSK